MAKTKWIIFGGARGGGKSFIVRFDAKLRALKYPGIKILIVRRTYPELVANHINTLRKELAGFAKYNDRDKVLKFPNGSTISFTYCSCDSDLSHLQGTELDQIYIDEATFLSEYQIKAIYACLRGTGNYPRHIVLTCNPGGQGHSFVKRIAIDKIYQDGENPDDYTFIQSKATDNFALMEAMPDYVKQLEALPEKLRKAWLEGDWNIFDGVFFEEYLDNPNHYKDRLWTNVIDPIEVPEEWTIYRAFDWGYSKPFSTLWIGVDRENIAYVFMELYGCTKTPNEGVKWTADKLFSEIHKIETEHRWLKGKQIHGVADPAIWNAETGESIADTAAKYQVFFSKGDNSRINGWQQVHLRMTPDENGYPMLYIFSTCKELRRCIPLMMYDEHKIEDLDTDLEDHCLRGDTQVLTDKGYKSIESLVGTEGKVMSSDGQYHNYYDVRLTRKQADIYAVEMEDGTTIHCTADHRFMLPNGEWIRVKNLSSGEWLKTDIGQGSRVKIYKSAGKADVFNMEVEDTHDFVIQGGIISHNCLDSLRYFAMSRPIVPRVKTAPDEYDKSVLSQVFEIPREELQKKQKYQRTEVITNGSIQ